MIAAPLLPAAVANGMALANISVGSALAVAQTYIASPDASLGSYLLAGALGGLGGYFAPYSIYGGIAGTVVGGGVGYGFGDWRVGAQIGGLAGQIIGGGVQFGWPAAAFEASGAIAGAGIGYAYSHNIHDALFGANMGSMAGGIAHSGYSAYSRTRSVRVAAVSAPIADQPLLLSYQPTTHTLSQIRKMRQPAKWRAGADPGSTLEEARRNASNAGARGV